MKFYGSLPPLLETPIEGELQVRILKPSLIPPLANTQALEFSFTWFGNNFPCTACLDCGEEEITIRFSIHCDARRFRRYLRDTNNLKIFVKVKDDQKNSPSKQVHHSYIARNRKKWKDGDYIGCFILRNLKLNLEGWYIQESAIHDNFNNFCGSINVYMVYANNVESSTALTFNKSQETMLKPCIKEAVSSPLDNTEFEVVRKKQNIESINSSKQTHNTNKDKKKQVSIKPPLLKKPNSNPKPTDNVELKPKELQRPPNATVETPSKLLDNVIAKCDPSELNSATNDHNDSAIYQAKKSFTSQDFVMTDLFSLIDANVISKDQLFHLMQINHGFTPSCEFGDSSPTSEREHKNQDERHPLHKLNGNYSKNADSITGIFPLSISSAECSPKTSVFPALRTVEQVEEPSQVVEYPKNVVDSSSIQSQIKEGSSVCFNDLPLQEDDDCSLLMLEIHNLILNDRDYKVAEFTKTSSQKVSIPVRKRSKVCFILHFSFHFAHKNQEEEVTFVSRRFESGAVHFNSSINVKFPALEKMEDGVLKMKVIRRTLGKMRGEEIAFSVIMMNEILQFEPASYEVKLWAPNDSSISSSVDMKVLKYPIGSLYFKACFVLSNPRCILSKQEDHSQINHECSKSAQRDHKIQQMPLSKEQEGSYYPPLELSSSKTYLQDKSGETCFSQDSLLTIPLKVDENNRTSVSQINPPSFEESPEILRDNQNPNMDHELQNVEVTCSSQQEERNDFSFVSLKGTPNNDSVFTHPDENITFNRSMTTCLSGEENKLHLEILEAQILPSILLENNKFFPPCCYAKASLRVLNIETKVIPFSSNPTWDFRQDIPFEFDGLKETNGHLIIKVYHCLSGVNTHPEDPLLGFASINTTSLRGGHVSLCGWFPLLDISGRKCGKMKVSLTPHEPPSNIFCPELHRPIHSASSVQEKAGELSQAALPNEMSFVCPEQRNCADSLSHPEISPKAVNKDSINQNDELVQKREFHCSCCPSSKQLNSSSLNQNEKTYHSPSEDKNFQVHSHIQGQEVEPESTLRPHFPDLPESNSRDMTLQRSSSHDSYVDLSKKAHYQKLLQLRSNSEEAPSRQSVSIETLLRTSSQYQGFHRQKEAKISSQGFNPIFDTFCWMNRMSCNLDSPSVSYISVHSQTMNSFQNRHLPPHGKAKMSAATKPRRRQRIAANFDYS